VNRPARAFTLIELMLSMVFIVMLTMTLYTALRVGIRDIRTGCLDGARSAVEIGPLVQAFGRHAADGDLLRHRQR